MPAVTPDKDQTVEVMFVGSSITYMLTVPDATISIMLNASLLSMRNFVQFLVPEAVD